MSVSNGQIQTNNGRPTLTKTFAAVRYDWVGGRSQERRRHEGYLRNKLKRPKVVRPERFKYRRGVAAVFEEVRRVRRTPRRSGLPDQAADVLLKQHHGFCAKEECPTTK